VTAAKKSVRKSIRLVKFSSRLELPFKLPAAGDPEHLQPSRAKWAFLILVSAYSPPPRNAKLLSAFSAHSSQRSHVNSRKAIDSLFQASRSALLASPKSLWLKRKACGSRERDNRGGLARLRRAGVRAARESDLSIFSQRTQSLRTFVTLRTSVTQPNIFFCLFYLLRMVRLLHLELLRETLGTVSKPTTSIMLSDLRKGVINNGTNNER
jgi:hypothetical protein